MVMFEVPAAHEASHYSNPEFEFEDEGHAYSNPEFEFEDEVSHYSSPEFEFEDEVSHYNPNSTSEQEFEAESDRFLGNILGGLLGEGEASHEEEYEFEDEISHYSHPEMEDEADMF